MNLYNPNYGMPNYQQYPDPNQGTQVDQLDYRQQPFGTQQQSFGTQHHHTHHHTHHHHHHHHTGTSGHTTHMGHTS